MSSTTAGGAAEGLIIPDHVQILGDTGHFYTVVAVETEDSKAEAKEQEEEGDDEEDVLVCGKCKAQFSDLQLFIQHKKKDCRTKKDKAKSVQDGGVEVEAEQEQVYFTVDTSPYLPQKSKDVKVKAGKEKSPGGEEGGEEVYFSVLCDNSSLAQLYIDSPSLLPLALDSQPAQEPAQTEDRGSSLEISLLPPGAKRQKIDSEEPKGLKTPRPSPPDKESSLNKKLFCSYCHKGFNKNFDLAQHVRSHTGERPYQCVICGRGFAQKSNVKKHMTTHKVWPLGHKTLPSEEPSQGRTLSTSESLSPSTQKVTLAVNTSYQCQYCKENFNKYPEFKTHLKIHEAEKNYKCTVRNCGKLFVDLDMFLSHTSQHDNKEYRCHICSRMFKDLNQLNLHSYTHITDEQTREKQFFQCSKCKNKYSSMEALDHHLDTASHSFLCDLCDKEFASERLFRKHLAVTHSEGMFQCQICRKKMKNEHYLKSHMMIHTGELPYECKDCGAKFNRNDKLKRHSLIHSTVKQYKCPFKDHMGCTKEFHRFDKLKLHIMTHGNIKPFKCNICDNGFSRKEHLNAHLQKIHNNNKGDQKSNCNLKLTEHSKPNAESAAKIKESKNVDDNVDDNDDNSNTEYKLPDRVTDSSLGKSLETFRCDTSGEVEERKVKESSGPTETLQISVGSAASKAMEILYSNGENS